MQANAAAVGDPVNSLAPAFFPILTPESGDDMPPQLVSVMSNKPLDEIHTRIKRVVIGVHDSMRDANALFAQLQTLAGPAAAETMIMAPQFLASVDLERFKAFLPENGKMVAVWPLLSWQYGVDSVPQGMKRAISSFAVVDLLLAYASDRTYFPSLETVVLAGYDAGADFVQRYAFAGKGPELVDAARIDMRFVAANPNHFLYFTLQRPFAPQPAPDVKNQSLQRTKTPDVTQCPGYNYYPYGLERVPSYVQKQGVMDARLRYPARAVHVLISDQSPQDTAAIDHACAADWQGADRKARAENYFTYLKTLYGDLASQRQQLHQLYTAPASAVGLFGSPCGAALLFGDGACAANGAVRGSEIP